MAGQMDNSLSEKVMVTRQGGVASVPRAAPLLVEASLGLWDISAEKPFLPYLCFLSSGILTVGSRPGAQRAPSPKREEGGSRPWRTRRCSWSPRCQAGDLGESTPPTDEGAPGATLEAARLLLPRLQPGPCLLPRSLILQRYQTAPLFNKTVRTTDLCKAHSSLLLSLLSFQIQ